MTQNDEIRQGKNVGGAFSEGQPSPQPKEREPSVPKFLGPSAYAQTYDRTTSFLRGVQRSVLHGPPRPRCPTLGRASWDKKIVLGLNMYAHTFIPNEC